VSSRRLLRLKLPKLLKYLKSKPQLLLLKSNPLQLLKPWPPMISCSSWLKLRAKLRELVLKWTKPSKPSFLMPFRPSSRSSRLGS